MRRIQWQSGRQDESGGSPPCLFLEIDRLKAELKEAGIVTTPGSGFGAPGEGYIRRALTVSRERIQEAVARIEKLSF